MGGREPVQGHIRFDGHFSIVLYFRGGQLKNKLIYSPVTCGRGGRVHSGACNIDYSGSGGRVLSTRDYPK